VIRHLTTSRTEQTVVEVVTGISSDRNQPYTCASVNEALDGLAIQGLAIKADFGGECPYRWANFLRSECRSGSYGAGHLDAELVPAPPVEHAGNRAPHFGDCAFIQ
jgi:hypothetical protein